MASVKEEKKTLVGKENVREILAQMGVGAQAQVTTFKHEEDDEDYAVWKIEENGRKYVLKKADNQELEINQAFLSDLDRGAPHLYKSLNFQGNVYLLMEYVEGHDLRNCDRESLTAVLDALIYLQNRYWERRDLESAGFGFAASLPGREKRGKYLGDAELEQAYEEFLKIYIQTPRTLCHDDLLPFNVLCSGDRAVLIDWEYAGILPYPTSLARLLAHGEEDENAFFRMTKADKDFAIDYYFEHLLLEKGIKYPEYRRTMDYFLLYEYCEWVAIGVKYGETNTERYRMYYAKAKEHLKKLK